MAEPQSNSEELASILADLTIAKCESGMSVEAAVREAVAEFVRQMCIFHVVAAAEHAAAKFRKELEHGGEA